MADEPMTEEEARRRFVAYLIAVDARGPAPDCEERLAAIFAEHESECDRLERGEAHAPRLMRPSDTLSGDALADLAP